MNLIRATFIRKTAYFLLVVLGLVASYFWLAKPYVGTANTAWLDYQFKRRQEPFPPTAQHDIVVVGIDDGFLSAIPEPLTLVHPYLGELLHALSATHPRAVGFDVVLPTKRYEDMYSARAPNRGYHQSLLEGLMAGTRAYPLVFGIALNEKLNGFQNPQIDYTSILTSQDRRAGLQWSPFGSVQFCQDNDGLIRRYPGPMCQPDGTPWTLSSSLAAAGYGLEPTWSGFSNFRRDGRFDYLPIQAVLNAYERKDSAQLSRWFNGAIVLVGTSFQFGDTLAVPGTLWACQPSVTNVNDCAIHGNRVPGVMVHAQLIRTMLHHDFIAPVPGYIVWLFMVFGLCFWFGTKTLQKLAALIGFLAVLAIASWIGIDRHIWFAPFDAAYIACVSLGVRSYVEGWKNFRERRRLTATFAGYVSPPVLKELLREDIEAVGTPRECHIAVLFSDLRGYTTISERISPVQLLDVMNQYFEVMSEIVHKHGGTVDKFIGDGMLNYFGAPNHLACPEQSAFDAAREMLAELNTFNKKIGEKGFPPFEIGIGLHSGPAVVGNVGPSNRYDYTVVGDTVNTGSRVEGLSKKLGVAMVLSKDVSNKLKDAEDLVDFGVQEIKGRAAIHVFGWKSST